MTRLHRPYIQVRRGDALSYGGNQMLSESKALRQCGCGPVAALDLLLYLEHADAPLPLSDYNARLRALTRRYFPLLPPFGINGLLLVAGLNRIFLERKLPYRARWVVSGAQLWQRIEGMLERDLPVILAVGPNFPMVWGKDRLNFYSKTRDGRYVPAAATKGHYVTATGLDGDWLQIASWGRRFYISRAEYEQYVKRHSNYLFSNIVLLTRV